MIKINRLIPFFVLTLVLFSCSQESSSLVSRSYHNLTAKYNAYFLAKEKMLEIEHDVQEMHVEDFNTIIDILPQIDSSKTKGLQEKFDYCMEKAALPIKKHKNSNWVDDSYILLGKVRMFRGKFDVASQTFRYVIQQSDDKEAKHLALTYLIRCYMEENDLQNVKSIIALLDQEKMSGEVEQEYNLYKAHYYHKQLQFKKVIPSLELAIPHIKDKDRKARLHLALGQIYQRYNQSKKAVYHFTKATKRLPPYEVGFFAKLSKYQETDITNAKKLKKAERFYAVQLSEAKNKEYRGRVQFEMGKLKLKQEKLDEAISLLHASASEKDKYSSQKGYAYQLLGNLFYETEPEETQKESYKKAKLYYDSTVTVISDNVENYDVLITRHEVLTDFVKQVIIIEEQDSLLKLSTLDSASIKKIIDQSVATEKERQKQLIAKAKLEKAKEKQESSLNAFQGKSNFIFYNPDALATAKLAFIDNWGDRKLEDNWRRSTKELIEELIQNQDGTDTTVVSSPTKKVAEKEIQVDRSQFVKNIPFSDEQKAESNNKIIRAYYKLAKIYDFQLLDPVRARETYLTLLEKYPSNEYESEVLYSLYLLCKKTDCDEQVYANQVFAIYPNSIYAKLIRNPNYAADYQGKNALADKAYEKAYAYYLAGEYYQADVTINQTRAAYPSSSLDDKLVLLKAILLAKRNKLSAYKTALSAFQVNYKTSNLIPYAADLLEKADNFSANQLPTAIVPTDTVYDINAGEEHYFVALATTEGLLENKILGELYALNQKEFPDADLKANIFSYNNTLSVIRIRTFDFRQTAEIYAELMAKPGNLLDVYGSSIQHSFVITQTNLFRLMKSNDLVGYLNFYNERYLNIVKQ